MRSDVSPDHLEPVQEPEKMNIAYWSVMMTLMVIVMASLRTKTSAQLPSQENQLKFFMNVRNVLFKHIFKTGTEKEHLIRVARKDKLQRQVDDDVPFPCDLKGTRSPEPPESVHRLRPGDIDVVGALGDSLTAGNGIVATSLVHTVTENRGLSYTAGGQGTWRKFLTLPNILKEFNPNLIGYSSGDSWGHHKEAQFNVGEPGAVSRDMPFMAKELVRRIRADKRVNVTRDWKMVNVNIGGNDFCMWICFEKPQRYKNSAEIHRKDLIEAFDYIRDNLPRTIVNLVLTPSLRLLHDLKGLPQYCAGVYLFVCPCLFGIIHQANYESYINKISTWQAIETEIANDKRYQTKEDFAVVAQPFTENMIFPDIKGQAGMKDISYLSSDCFHLSQKGCARAANALWNNMMEPVGNKTRDWDDVFSRFLCPTAEHPYIYTNKNSQRLQT